MSAIAPGYCLVCRRDEMRDGHHEHCSVCIVAIELDDCDVDESGAGVEGSTKGFQCKSCVEWCCNACGDRKARLCKPCLIPAEGAKVA